MKTVYDVAVVGCGAGGYQAAITAARLGAQVALIERDTLGGSCLNRACVPKKALAHMANLLAETQALAGLGLSGRLTADLKAAIAFKDKLVAGLIRGLPVRLQSLSVDLRMGTAHLVAPHEIHLSGPREHATISARSIILATGSAPRALPPCPVDHIRIVNGDSFIESLSRAADTVLCIGGGALGIEAAFILRQFGSHVTIIESGPRLLDRPVISDRAAGFLERRLVALGVTVRKGVTVQETKAYQDGVWVQFSDGSEGQFDRVLVAVGRVPQSDDLGLAALGVRFDSAGFVVTDEYCATNVPGLYAIGDMCGGVMTAAGAMHDGRIAGENAAGGEKRQRRPHQVPLVIDSAVSVAAVGLSEDMAEAAGFTPGVLSVPFAASVKAQAYNDAGGFIEIVHDEETGQMLGGCVVGAGADELVHLLAAACLSRRGLWTFTDLNYGHPSSGEIMGAALDSYLGVLSQSVDTLFRPGIYAHPD